MAEKVKRNAFSGLEYKTFKTAVKQMLVDDFAFLGGPSVLELIAENIEKLANEYYRDVSSVTPGQMLWLAIDKDERSNHPKGMSRMKFKPVLLNILSKDDVTDLLERKKFRDIRIKTAIRLFNEAMNQGGVLSNSDVAAMLHYSPSTVSSYVRDYIKKTGKIPPTRGYVHDLGPAISHKVQIIADHLRNKTTPQIGRKHKHNPKAVDTYIKDYEKVKTASSKNISVDEIAFITGLSKRIVKEYLILYEKFEGGIKNDKKSSSEE